MREVDAFTWYGERGEPLKFRDLTEAEQRVALIASGALLQGGSVRRERKLVDKVEVPTTSAASIEGGGGLSSAA